MSGVYWTEDRITHPKSGWYDSVSPSNEPGQLLMRQIPENPEEFAEERHRFLEENARLLQQLGG